MAEQNNENLIRLKFFVDQNFDFELGDQQQQPPRDAHAGPADVPADAVDSEDPPLQPANGVPQPGEEG